MKPATQALRDTLMQDMAIKTQPRLIAEWEYNRFIAPAVTVTPVQTTTDQDWINAYDASSVTLPFRPTAGIARLRADNGVMPVDLGQSRGPGTSRYYPTPDTPLYSYFSSIQKSQLAPATAGDGYEFDAPIKITVDYGKTIAANKIVVGFETGYAAPSSYSIQVSPDGRAWQTVYSGSSINPDGTVSIWHSPVVGSGWGGTGWDVVEAHDAPVVMQAVRLVVYAMNKPASHADVLQISARLENDLTPYLVSYTAQISQDQPSFIAPLGKASSNTASIVLSNIDQRFNNDNVNSLYYQMIEKKVRFKMDVGIDTSNHGGTGLEYIREFTMWADSWAIDSNSTVTVSLKDSSVVLQERTMPPIFLNDATVGQIVWTTLDFIGMNNYAYTHTDNDYGVLIPFYWPSDTNEASNPRWNRVLVSSRNPPTTTIWDELSAMAEATQTAMYFDEYDVLQIKAREAMYNTGKKPDWNLDAVQNGTKLPDIISTSTNYTLTTNRVELAYKPCAMAQDNNGFPKMEVVWVPQNPVDTSIIPGFADSGLSTTPTSKPTKANPKTKPTKARSKSATVTQAGAVTITLLASALVKDCLKTDTELWVEQDEAALWHFQGDVNIEGEYMHYYGKEYAYYDALGNYQTDICYQQSDQDYFDSLNDSLEWKNDFTGRLLITDRAQMGSAINNHYVQTNSYNTIATSWNKQFYQALGTGWTTQKNGYITQNTFVNSGVNDYPFITSLRQHPQAVNGINGNNSVWYGARIRFPGKGQGVADATDQANWHVGGIHFAGDGAGNGYYLEVTTTTQVDGYEKRRWRNEFSLQGIPASGNFIQYAGTNINDADGTNTTTNNPDGTTTVTPNKVGDKGFRANVNEDDWNDIDINYYTGADGTDHITVYNKGVFVADWDIPANQKPNHVNNWRFGTFVRGPSAGMDIEYLFAVGEDTTNPLDKPDATNFLDIRSGAFESGFIRSALVFACGPVTQQPSGYTVYGTTQNNTHFAYDEFGPVVHEVRTFDEVFNTQYIPVIGSYLYLTNPHVVCLKYNSDSSGAEFVLANASRKIEVVQGADVSTDGSSTINYTLSIYGRVVYQAQSDTIKIVANNDAIRRQGLTRTQFTSRYIQTDDMASAIGEWITSLWATGVDQVSADIFGNPLLQVGDLVTINYPVKGMTPTTHQYFVTAVNNSFTGKGYTGKTTLRRARTV